MPELSGSRPTQPSKSGREMTIRATPAARRIRGKSRMVPKSPRNEATSIVPGTRKIHATAERRSCDRNTTRCGQGGCSRRTGGLSPPHTTHGLDKLSDSSIAAFTENSTVGKMPATTSNTRSFMVQYDSILNARRIPSELQALSGRYMSDNIHSSKIRRMHPPPHIRHCSRNE
jgi:hypothetical protein